MSLFRRTNVGYGTYFENIEALHWTKECNLITDSEQADNLESRWLNEKNRQKALNDGINEMRFQGPSVICKWIF